MPVTLGSINPRAPTSLWSTSSPTTTHPVSVMSSQLPVNNTMPLSTQETLVSAFAILSLVIVFHLPKLTHPNTDISTLAGHVLNSVSYVFSAVLSLFQSVWEWISNPIFHSHGTGASSSFPAHHTDISLLSGSIGLISHVLCVVVSTGTEADGSGCGYVTRLFITLRRQLLPFVRRGGLHAPESSSLSVLAGLRLPRLNASYLGKLPGKGSDAGGGVAMYRGVSFAQLTSSPSASTPRRGDGRVAGMTERNHRRAVRRGVAPSIPRRESSLGRVQAIVPEGWKREGRNWGRFNFPESDLDSRLVFGTGEGSGGGIAGGLRREGTV
ncbi:hypothetical protein B0T16DRAFT_490926 [Cercophora newfieldiana]|uniref:Uncharacterized protein n=1 Tax=Cercophora newfieldiana TaxID=92897 RepID=A0AA39YAK7_9PEZI|nr:hypothetical protein B0T16DRAFT_490926 [Cercophora newfieldiana]